jgi:hypothetical protein
MSYTIDLLKKTIKYHGVSSAIHVASMIAINRILTVKILRCAVLSKIKSTELEVDPKYQIGFLDENQIIARFGSGYNDLSAGFVQLALKKGDRCMCVIDDNDEVLSYSWFSHEETNSDLDQLIFSFDQDYVYTYKVFTHIHQRGQRLHRHQMHLALKHFQKEGFKGIVCYINSDNFDSLKSHFKMGFLDAGMIVAIKFFGKYYHFKTKTCAKYAIQLKEKMSALITENTVC